MDLGYFDAFFVFAMMSLVAEVMVLVTLLSKESSSLDSHRWMEFTCP